MAVLNKIKRAVRGEVKLTTVALEALRRSRASLQQRTERANLDADEPLMLAAAFARMSADELLAYFRGERHARFIDGFFEREPADTTSADRIVDDHSWPLLGFGEKCFGEEIQWTRDPLSNYVWPLDYHRDIKLVRGDGSDVRVLWELNRFGQFLTLARGILKERGAIRSIWFIPLIRQGSSRASRSRWSERQRQLLTPSILACR